MKIVAEKGQVTSCSSKNDNDNNEKHPVFHQTYYSGRIPGMQENICEQTMNPQKMRRGREGKTVKNCYNRAKSELNL